MERARAQIWREVAHDVRGAVGAISSASNLLNREALPEAMRNQSSAILRRAVVSLHELLTEMIDLARIEAGQERRHVFAFDAAQMLRDFGEGRQNLAHERGLYFKMRGPENLPVLGDPIKVQRIAQNLLLNAINATATGGVELTWDRRGEDHWYLCVSDTGPGLSRGPAEYLEQALKVATEESSNVDARASAAGRLDELPSPAATLTSQSRYRMTELGGEGIGLAIVKRLCELLDATLEFHTAEGEGATFRVIFPLRYEPAEAASTASAPAPDIEPPSI